MYFLMQGTPFIYQGQEIGMTNMQFDGIEDFDCVVAKNQYAQLHEEGMPEQEILHLLAQTGRDNLRTPMQWDVTAHAGFSTVTPWLKVNPNYEKINVAEQRSNSGSVFNFYRKLIALRKAEPALIYGNYDLQLEDDQQIYAYTRTLDGQQLLIMCNLTGLPAQYNYRDCVPTSEDLLLGNYSVAPHGAKNSLVLLPFEARVYRLFEA